MIDRTTKHEKTIARTLHRIRAAGCRTQFFEAEAADDALFVVVTADDARLLREAERAKPVEVPRNT